MKGIVSTVLKMVAVSCQWLNIGIIGQGKSYFFRKVRGNIYIFTKKLENVCFLPKSNENCCQKICIKPDYARGIAQI